MAAYKANSRFAAGGITYRPGDTVDIGEEEAKSLIRIGYIVADSIVAPRPEPVPVPVVPDKPKKASAKKA